MTADEAPIFGRSVAFHTRDSSRLAGTFVLPMEASPDHRVPAVVLCQGLSGVTDLVLPEVARCFAVAGFASLAFDYRGYGQSEGEKGWILPRSRVVDALHAFSSSNPGIKLRSPSLRLNVPAAGILHDNNLSLCPGPKQSSASDEPSLPRPLQTCGSCSKQLTLRRMASSWKSASAISSLYLLATPRALSSILRSSSRLLVSAKTSKSSCGI